MEQIDKLSPRPASASASEQAHIVTVGNMNGANRLFGGLLFSWLDETAGVTARRHARTHVTTASVENLRYLQPVVRNQVLMCEARVIYTFITFRLALFSARRLLQELNSVFRRRLSLSRDVSYRMKWSKA